MVYPAAVEGVGLVFTQAQREYWYGRLSDKYEPMYQHDAYFHLVTWPFKKAVKSLEGEMNDLRTAELLNKSIRESIMEWLETKAHYGREFRPERFLWTLKPNAHHTGYVPDQFPAILNQLRDGVADTVFFRPSHDTFVSMVREEIELERRKTLSSSNW